MFAYTYTSSYKHKQNNDTLTGTIIVTREPYNHRVTLALDNVFTGLW